MFQEMMPMGGSGGEETIKCAKGSVELAKNTTSNPIDTGLSQISQLFITSEHGGIMFVTGYDSNWGTSNFQVMHGSTSTGNGAGAGGTIGSVSRNSWYVPIGSISDGTFTIIATDNPSPHTYNWFAFE